MIFNILCQNLHKTLLPQKSVVRLHSYVPHWTQRLAAKDSKF